MTAAITDEELYGGRSTLVEAERQAQMARLQRPFVDHAILRAQAVARSTLQLARDAATLMRLEQST